LTRDFFVILAILLPHGVDDRQVMKQNEKAKFLLRLALRYYIRKLLFPIKMTAFYICNAHFFCYAIKEATENRREQSCYFLALHQLTSHTHTN